MIAAVSVSYYGNTARILHASIMMYDSRLKNFKFHIDVIKEKETNDTLESPKLTRNLPIKKYIEGLDVHLGSKDGAMNCPMSWVTRANAIVSVAAPAMAPNQPYSIEHGPVSQEMIQRYSHSHTLYATENATVYDDWTLPCVAPSIMLPLPPASVEGVVE